MADKSYLEWPFFEERHRRLVQELDAWAAENLQRAEAADVDAQCRKLVRQLGDGGWVSHAVAGKPYGGAADVIDTHAICLVRETLARHSGLADFAFAMQGLGSGAIVVAMSCAARPDGDGHVIDGEKTWISNGGIADAHVVFARTGEGDDAGAALQLWGGLGVVTAQPVERLYREIRALRIYEGATEVQQLIIARELLKAWRT